jgi:hypothetical protein
MRRFPALVALLVGSVALGLAPVAAAQEATPVVALPAALGLPTVPITITDTGFEAPAQLPAGRVLLTVTNAATGSPIAADAALVQLPAGTTVADVQAFFGPPPATPTTGATASPATAAGGAPSWLYAATWAGGPIVPPGQTIAAVVELTPGDWLLLNDSLGAPQQPQPLTVTGTTASPTPPTAPTADVTIRLQEYAFVGLEQGVPAGPQLWQITNTGAQPHFLQLLGAPTGATMDQVRTLLQLPENATPPPGFPYGPEAFDFAQPGLAVISPGHTAWLALDLASGTYLALCFVPDQQTGAPHALLGMAQLFTVGGVDAGAATPAA